jgi:hypothetical protein
MMCRMNQKTKVESDGEKRYHVFSPASPHQTYVTVKAHDVSNRSGSKNVSIIIVKGDVRKVSNPMVERWECEMC